MSRPIEEFEVPYNGGSDWIGFIEIELVDDPIRKMDLIMGAFKTTIGGKEYARMGMMKAGYGTLLTKEQFQPYYNVYGDLMLNQAEYKQLIADNAPEEIG